MFKFLLSNSFIVASDSTFAMSLVRSFLPGIVFKIKKIKKMRQPELGRRQKATKRNLENVKFKE